MLPLRVLPRLLLLLVLAAMAAAKQAGAELRLAPGEALRNADIEALLAPVLPNASAGRRLGVRVFSPALPLLNAGAQPALVRLVALEREGARFAARLEVAVEDGAANPLVLRGKLVTLIEVPVAARHLPPGHVVAAPDLVAEQVEEGLLAADAVLEPGEAVGRETVRRVRSGRPLRRAELRPARLVRRGEHVSVRLVHRGLEITGLGIAGADGALGEVVSVLNAESRREIRGRVIAPGVVEPLPGVPGSGMRAAGSWGTRR